MPVWNGEMYLREAVDSVLNQSFQNIELIIVNDFSTDGTQAILSSLDDCRVRVLQNACNVGIAASLRRAVEAAEGKYIARIDADDVCLRSRIERQVRFMEKNPQVDVLGGGAVLFGRRPTRLKFVAHRDSDIRAELLFRSAMIHPTVMFRKDSIEEWYDPHQGAVEDYELWVRLAASRTVFANLRAPLIRYRLHTMRTTEVRASQNLAETNAVQIKALLPLLEDIDNDEELALRAVWGHPQVTPAVLNTYVDLCLRMVESNARRQMIEPTALRRRAAYEISSTLLSNLPVARRLVGKNRWTALRLLGANPLSSMKGGSYALSRAVVRHSRFGESGR